MNRLGSASHSKDERGLLALTRGALGEGRQAGKEKEHLRAMAAALGRSIGGELAVKDDCDGVNSFCV